MYYGPRTVTNGLTLILDAADKNSYSGSVNTNTWNNVIVTWNGSAGRCYFNGVDKGALNIGANGIQISGYTVAATAGGSTAHVFEGNLSQVFVYNRAISATEALQNYNSTKTRFGL